MTAALTINLLAAAARSIEHAVFARLGSRDIRVSRHIQRVLSAPRNSGGSSHILSAVAGRPASRRNGRSGARPLR